jgi:hypothetical protein
MRGSQIVLLRNIDDPKRDYYDDLRRLQLKMKILGSNWDITVIRRVEQVGEAPVDAPYLTRTASPPEAAEVAIPAMVEEAKAFAE